MGKWGIRVWVIIAICASPIPFAMYCVLSSIPSPASLGESIFIICWFNTIHSYIFTPHVYVCEILYYTDCGGREGQYIG